MPRLGHGIVCIQFATNPSNILAISLTSTNPCLCYQPSQGSWPKLPCFHGPAPKGPRAEDCYQAVALKWPSVHRPCHLHLHGTNGLGNELGQLGQLGLERSCTILISKDKGQEWTEVHLSPSVKSRLWDLSVEVAFCS